MSAFITRSNLLPFANSTKLRKAISGRRPDVRWSPASVPVSLTTEEAKPANETIKIPQSRLETPNPPKRPSPPSRLGNDTESTTTPQSQIEAPAINPPTQSPSLDEENKLDIETSEIDSDSTSSTNTIETKPVYYTTCGVCSAVYELDPEILGEGKKVRCEVCGNQWFQKPDRLAKLDEGQVFKDYPIEEKDEYIKKNRERREENRRIRSQSRTSEEPRSIGGSRTADGPGSRRPSFDRRGGRRDGNRSRQGFSVFIGNLPYSITEEDLEQFVSTSVKPRNITIIKGEDGRSRGFAFAALKSQDEVDTAVETLDGILLQGRNVTVKPGRRK